MAALNKDETKSVGDARDLLKQLVETKPDLTNPQHTYWLAQAKRLAAELDAVYQMKGYYPNG
jgi:hypothetical protein